MHNTSILKGLFFLILIAFLLSPFNNQLVAQEMPLPFKSGEKLHYKVSYNWEFVWVDAGKVVFEVDSIQYKNLPAYQFKSYGRSLSTYDWIFKVRDNFQSVANAQSLQPYHFKRNTQEGGYTVNNSLDFNYTDNQVISFTENSQHPASIDTLAIEGLMLDLQTAVYYARTLDYKAMRIGEKIPFRVIMDGEIFDMYGRYLGVETIENYDRKIYRCHKFSALLIDGTIFTGGEDLFVWLTDDKNHIPILVEAKIMVGSVKAYFTKGENIFHPMEALVE
jgi:hypothetical protein